MKKLFLAIVLLVVIAFGITFTLKNPQNAEVHYYFGLQWSGPLSMILLFSWACGIVVGFLANLAIVLRTRSRLRQTRREVKRSTKEVASLRELPVKDGV